MLLKTRNSVLTLRTWGGRVDCWRPLQLERRIKQVYETVNETLAGWRDPSEQETKQMVSSGMLWCIIRLTRVTNQPGWMSDAMLLKITFYPNSLQLYTMDSRAHKHALQ